MLCEIMSNVLIGNLRSMFVYPSIDPIALKLGPIHIHWYGVMYLIGFLSAWGLAIWRGCRNSSAWTQEQITDLILYAAVGVLVGGRVGYMLFYNFDVFLSNPLSILKIWEGGMSFHGGLLGVVISFCLFARKINKSFFEIMDFILPMVPIGLAAGRIGNFINGELWGRVTDVPWAMIYPHVDNQPRHPSELYEFVLEGLVLFAILWFFSAKPRPRMAVSGLFSLLYGTFRFTCEFFRQPDPQLGFIAFGWLTQGQLLSLPMIIIGGLLLGFAYRKISVKD